MKAFDRIIQEQNTKLKIAVKKTKYIAIILIIVNLCACDTSKRLKTYDTIEKTEKAIARQHKKEAKLAKKESKKAYKNHWKNQSKNVKRSLRKNEKRMDTNKKKQRNIHTPSNTLTH